MILGHKDLPPAPVMVLLRMHAAHGLRVRARGMLLLCVRASVHA